MKWYCEFVWSNYQRRVGRCIFEFALPTAAIMVPVVTKHTVCAAVQAWRIAVHAGMHVAMRMRLSGRTIRTIAAVIDVQSHRTRLQRQVQPHSHEQAQSAAAPGLLLSDLGEVTQVLVSTTISAISPNRDTQAMGNSTYRSSAQSSFLFSAPFRLDIYADFFEEPGWKDAAGGDNHRVVF